jgi:hypothetical protein
LSGLALFLKNTFSSVHEEVIGDTFAANSGIFVVNFTKFADFVAVVVITQVLSWWTWIWLFDLEADTV